MNNLQRRISFAVVSMILTINSYGAGLDSKMGETILGTLCFVVFGGLFVLTAVLAQKRNKNVPVWILLGLLLTPVLTTIILLCLKKDKK